MNGLMLDSVNAKAIESAVADRSTFRGMPIVAAALYLDGKFAAPAWVFPMLRRAGIKVIGITVTGAPGAHAARIKKAADVEPGDLDPPSAAAWAEAERKAGEYPALYSDRAEKPAVIHECLARGMEPGRDFGLWVATLDGTFEDLGGADLRHEPGVLAVQAYPASVLGIEADGSVITPRGRAWLKLPQTWEEHARDLAGELLDLLDRHI